MIRRIYIFLLSIVLLTSCGDDNKAIPAGVLKPEKMQAVLWDVIRAEAFTNQFIKTDSAKNAEAENLKLQQEIFAIHKVSRAEFYSSYDYYKKNTVVFKTMLDSMVIQAQRNKTLNIKPLQAN